ncbi:hypothetical protein K3495_g3352 [Podosphaera aphanis]|nr:hypothetical protein K3495_g3352 [Podosphaera aphanis]
MKSKLGKCKNVELSMLGKDIDDAIGALAEHRVEWTKTPQKVSPLEERMTTLEDAVKKSLAQFGRQSVSLVASGLATKPTYAAVAAVAAMPESRSAVTIRIPQAEGMKPAELLSVAKQNIEGAYSVRQMRSNDTEVILQSKAQRDAALSMEQPDNFKIARQDYLVEVMGVPLSTKINGGKDTKNEDLINSICHASRARIPSLAINRIRWLHNEKEQVQDIKRGHTRGSIVLSLPAESLQWKVVRYGVVIDSILYAAQLWSPRGQAKQCFNCSQWGHTQTVCSRAAKCDECAGAHQS